MEPPQRAAGAVADTSMYASTLLYLAVVTAGPVHGLRHARLEYLGAAVAW